MPRPIVLYVRYVEAVNRVIGRLAMLIIFALMGILLLSSVSRTALNISFIWTVEMAQFMLAAFYMLGGGYSMQLGSHVRMDLLYSRWSPRGQALADVITSFFLLFYLVFLLLGGISSTQYALQYGQRNYSSWASAAVADQDHHDVRHHHDAASGHRHVLPGPSDGERENGSKP
jgi:TRAP-type mannitol/chloroaromatic compound transport system permease small subunit